MSDTPIDSTQQPSVAHRFQERSKPRELDLGGGLIVKYRKADLATLLYSGIVPAPLADTFMNLETENDPETGKTKAKIKPEQRADVMKVQAIIVRHSLVSPKIVEDGVEPNYDDDEIAMTDLSVDEIGQIFVEAIDDPEEVAKTVEPFRGERVDAAPGPDLSSVSQPTAK